MNQTWPAELDPIRRLRVLAAAIPGTTPPAEIVIPARFDVVWGIVSDLENELPRLLATVKSFRITSAEGERMEAYAVGTLGQRARFDVVLRPGWCLMRSRFVLGAMAAVPEGESTRFASLGGLRVPGAALLRPVLNALGNRAVRRLARHPGLCPGP